MPGTPRRSRRVLTANGARSSDNRPRIERPTTGSERAAQPTTAIARPFLPSVELLAWIAIGAVAIGIRGLNLDGAPLQPNESAIALDSWKIVQRTGLTIAPSPLLIYANALIVLVLGATDVTVRLLPMVAGSLVALSPLAFRSRIGRLGALIAGITVATSPTLIVASRQVDSTMVSLALAIALVILLTSGEPGRSPTRLSLAAGVLALLLMSGPTAFSLLIILGGFALIVSRRGAESGKDAVEPPPAPSVVAGQWWGSDSARITVAAARAALVTGGLVYLIAATGFGTNPIGIGDAIAGPLNVWRSALLGNGPLGIDTIPLLALGYEPVAVVFGAVGIVIALGRKLRFEEFLVWWTVVGTSLYAIATGVYPTWFAIPLTSLAFLAGVAGEEMARSTHGIKSWQPIGLFVVLGLSFLASTVIALGNVSLPEPNVPTAILVLPVFACAILVISFLSQWGWPTTRVAVGVVGIVTLVGLNVHAATLLNPGASLSPAEVSVGTATSPDVRTMARDVSVVLDELQIARQVEGRPVTDTVQITEPFADPLLWYLRQSHQIEVVSSVDDTAAIAIVSQPTKPPRGSYAGVLYQIARSAPLPGLDFKEIVRWWLYRQPPAETGIFVRVFVKAQLGRP